MHRQSSMVNCADVDHIQCSSIITMMYSLPNLLNYGNRLPSNQPYVKENYTHVAYAITRVRLRHVWRLSVLCVLPMVNFPSRCVGLLREKKKLVVPISRPLQRSMLHYYKRMDVCGKVRALMRRGGQNST